MSHVNLEARRQRNLFLLQIGAISEAKYWQEEEEIKREEEEQEPKEREEKERKEQERKEREEKERKEREKTSAPSQTTIRTDNSSSLEFDILQAELAISALCIPGLTFLSLFCDHNQNPNSNIGVALLLCIGAWALGCFSHGFALADKKKAEYGSDALDDKIERGVLNTLHLSSFLALAYVTANSTMNVMNNGAPIEKEALIVAGSCCAYNLLTIGLNWLKLHTR